MFLVRNDNNFLTECVFLKDDFNRLCKEFINILIEQREEYLDYIENEEESIIENFLNK